MARYGISVLLINLALIRVTFGQPQIEKCNFIIVGAGTAGSLLANRLSENASVRVCLIEAGGKPNAYTQIPLAVPITFYDPSINWNYKMEPQTIGFLGTINRQPLYMRGKVLGGTSGMNGLIYNRGSHEDYNLWSEMGATNWSYDEVLPYFKKTEGNRIVAPIDPEYHGTKGEQTVELSTYHSKMASAFLDAGEYLKVPTRDINGEKQFGFSPVPLAERNGFRCSSEKAFLRPAYKRSNLVIITNALVTKVDIDDKNRARGVFILQGVKEAYVSATTEVILAAGAVNSPQILQLSGVGPRDLLNQLKIPVKSGIPVGENFQEHVTATGSFYTVNVTGAFKVGDLMESAFQSTCPLKGELTYGTTTTLGTIKTTYETRPGDYNDIQIAFQEFLTLFLGLKPEYYLNYAPYAIDNVYTINVEHLHPKTRGTIFIKSTDPKEPPVIKFNFFENPQDLAALVEGLKFARSLFKSPALQKIDSKPIAEPLIGCEGFDVESDEYLECQAKTLTVPAFHACCTCRMGSLEDDSTVVDPHLNVKGIENLRVIDASIMPIITSGNTNVPTLMIAEKGADMIKQKHNL